MECGIIIRGNCSPETEKYIREQLIGAANTITANLKKLNATGPVILFYSEKGGEYNYGK